MPSPQQLRTAYERDLTASFPPAELKPLRAIEEMWRSGRYRPWCLFDGGELAGEAFLWLGEPGWALLDYLCVPPGRRNGGLGALVLEKLRLAEPDAVLLAESEAPEHAPDPALARRRLGFYDRAGARLAGYDTEMFGVHYRTLYWAASPVADGELMARHRWIYQNRFSPERYEKYVKIPRDPRSPGGVKVPWEE